MNRSVEAAGLHATESIIEEHRFKLLKSSLNVCYMGSHRQSNARLPELTLSMSVLIYVALLNSLLGKELKLHVQINTSEKIVVQPSINAEPSINVEAKTKLIKIDGGYSHYESNISFSREPSNDEMNRLRISVLADDDESPLSFGTQYSELLWNEIKDNQFKIFLRRGEVLLRGEFGLNERLIYAITSQNGFRKQDVAFADAKGECRLHWEATFGESSIKMIAEEKLENPAVKKPIWKVWRFDLVPNENPKFVEITSQTQTNPGDTKKLSQ